MRNDGELKYVGEVHDLFDIAGLVGGGALGLLVGGFGTKRVVRFIAKTKRKKTPSRPNRLRQTTPQAQCRRQPQSRINQPTEPIAERKQPTEPRKKNRRFPLRFIPRRRSARQNKR